MNTQQELIKALIKAKEIIKQWHNMQSFLVKQPEDEIKKIWEIYDSKSPEMKQINAAIAQLEQSPVSVIKNEDWISAYNPPETNDSVLVSDGKEVWLGYHSKNGIWSVVYDGAPLVKEDKDWQQELFNYMNKEHGLILLQDEMNQIKEIFLPTKYPHTL